MPKITRHIFNRKKLASILNNLSVEHLADHTDYSDIKLRIDNWRSLIDRKILEGKNEISLQGDFLSDFFGKILGYKSINESPDRWHLYREKKTVTDATRSDAALGFFTSEKDDVRVIIELKDAKTNLDAKQKRKGAHYTPVEQAFLYSSKFDKKCKWIIVSNYKEIRLYNRNASMNEYESFKIADLSDVAVLKKFLYLLARKNLINKNKDSVTDRLYDSAEVEQEMISKEFYGKYKNLRLHLFEHLKAKNSAFDEAIILEKTQKILDRFIFVCYCEDFGLLPERIFRKMMEAVKNPLIFADVSQWDQLKNLFRAIDKGSPPHHINKFNGGLFEFDEILDGRLNIGDEIFDELAEITDYDFDSELNVNVLGHIFEQSITDIEEIKSSIAGKSFDKKKGKRKKDGVYYTPEYITRYIVEQAVGGWLEERKTELGFEALVELTEKDFDSIKYLKKTGAIKSNKNIKAHLEFWQEYKKKLSAVKVLDPACGSGAFLNQAFDYLYKEGQHVNEQIADLQKGQIEVFRLDEHILKNNLYGVDLNPESVEITKLSLWLKTADRDSELTALDDNIKCGNSLIDDPDVAGERAFKWSDEFSEIMGDGGFDVVIGNPPYVRQELLSKDLKNLMGSNFSNVANGIADLYVYFYELALNQLAQRGYLSFITPNKWFKTKYGRELRKFLKQFDIKEIIDFFELNIFEDASTEPQIITIKKAENQSELNYYPVKKTEDFLSKNIQPIKIQKKYLKDSEWIFSSQLQNEILTKMYLNSVSLKDYSNNGIYRGITTGLNKAFIIDKETKDRILKQDTKSAELLKPYIQSTDIKSYKLRNKNNYCFINTYYDLEINQNTYPGIYDHLIKFEDRLIARQDQGKSHFNLRACGFYKKFDESKIIYIHTAINHSFYYDTEGYYLNNNCYFISNADKFLSVWLNSSIFKFYKKLIFVAFGDASGRGRTRLNHDKMINVPIPDLSKEQKKPFEIMFDAITQKSQIRNDLETDFLNFLKSELKPQKITKKLENWPDSDWDQFKKELAKCKVKIKALSLKERKEWQEYFTEEKLKAAEIKSVIENTDREIDLMVYELYGLTEEEIKIVENAA
ncbi:Eco57I restriction-modification methylase domain-containing protein [Desulfococcaceae bacterium HSG9]|nr:Eco57I restriction-modification methylase domain-containing protein [Desulfococcaceae bacterium HSG9]